MDDNYPERGIVRVTWFILPARCCAGVVLATALCLFVRPSVCHKSALYQYGWTDRVRFRHRGFRRLILDICGKEIGYLQN